MIILASRAQALKLSLYRSWKGNFADELLYLLPSRGCKAVLVKYVHQFFGSNHSLALERQML